MTLWACVLETERPNAALMRSLALALLVVFASSVTSGAEDLELSDLDVAGWECLDRAEGTAKTQDAIERNRMKNRSPENQIAGLIESLDTAAFLKKIGGYGACEGIRIQSLAGFFRLHDKRFQATGHKAQKVRVTGYLMWDDDHNGSADVGSTIEYFGTNGFHHPWRSTAWEIHPIMKLEVVE